MEAAEAGYPLPVGGVGEMLVNRSEPMRRQHVTTAVWESVIHRAKNVAFAAPPMARHSGWANWLLVTLKGPVLSQLIQVSTAPYEYSRQVGGVPSPSSSLQSGDETHHSMQCHAQLRCYRSGEMQGDVDACSTDKA